MKNVTIVPGALARSNSFVKFYSDYLRLSLKNKPVRYTHKMRYGPSLYGRTQYVRADYTYSQDPNAQDNLIFLNPREPLIRDDESPKERKRKLKEYAQRIKEFNLFKKEIAKLYRVTKPRGYRAFITMFALFKVRIKTPVIKNNKLVDFLYTEEKRWLTVVPTSIDVDSFIVRYDAFIERLYSRVGSSFNYEDLLGIEEISFDILIKKYSTP